MLNKLCSNIYKKMEKRVTQCSNIADYYHDPMRDHIDSHMWPIFKQIRYVQVNDRTSTDEGRVLLIPFNRDGYHIELLSYREFKGLKKWILR